MSEGMKRQTRRIYSSEEKIKVAVSVLLSPSFFSDSSKISWMGLVVKSLFRIWKNFLLISCQK